MPASPGPVLLKEFPGNTRHLVGCAPGLATSLLKIRIRVANVAHRGAYSVLGITARPERICENSYDCNAQQKCGKFNPHLLPRSRLLKDGLQYTRIKQNRCQTGRMSRSMATMSDKWNSSGANLWEMGGNYLRLKVMRQHHLTAPFPTARPQENVPVCPGLDEG